jgi:hypothetical protein
MNDNLRLFRHRHKQDGSYDSICTTCFRTIATELTEPSLDQAERAHQCDPYGLYLRNRASFSPTIIRVRFPDLDRYEDR